LAGLGDIRKIGSGNIGATNVLRTGHKGLAALTLLLDAIKGTAAVWLGYWMNDAHGYTPILSGIAAFVGHVYPVWLGFRGGKGVATYIGVLLGLSWPFGLMFIVIWLSVAALSRYSSLSALLASVLVPIIMLVTYHWEGAGLLFVSALLVYKHHANIERLMAGTEPKIGAKS
jgi:glycerol-3-phosphate acyltransferase PlsY